MEIVYTQIIYGLGMSFAGALATTETWEIKNRHLTYPLSEHVTFFHLQLTNPYLNEK